MLRVITATNPLNVAQHTAPHTGLNLKPTNQTLTLATPQAQTLTLGPAKILTLGAIAQPGQRQAIQLNPNGPTAADYKKYDQRTHVYMVQGMYIGSDQPFVREEWLYDIQNQKMVSATIDFIPGCERLFLEIITNASDNVGRSRRAGVDPGRIDIIMDNSTISVTNYGLPMPIEIHPEEKVYIPEMTFGTMLTGSNYEVDRHEAGVNGIGAKATNIFSTEFMVIVHDHIRHLKYTQVWNTNMIQRADPIIEQYTGRISSVQVVYKMDFARFKLPIPNGTQGGYAPEAFALFARHAIDISFTAKVPVSFNGTEFNFANPRDYARLYFGDSVDSAILHYQWPEGTEVVHKKKGYQVAKNPAITPTVELIAIDTPDAGANNANHHVSFVNCMMTRDGGVHVNAAIKAVGDSAVKMINEKVLARLTRQNKGKELSAQEKRAHTININDVKPHISILLTVKVMNPTFTSQTKTVLASPTPKIDVAEEELKAINRWQLIDRLYAALEAKQFASMAKTDGGMKRYLRLQKGVDANQAGKAERSRCVLYASEGKSGAGYINKLIGLLPGGRDYAGVLPLRGKLFNVMDKDIFQIEKNKEIQELKKMLGLVEGTDYSIPANFNKLRYVALMIMADSDVDGKHITGLIINYFHCRFPSLLARGFVMFYRTPTLRVTHNRVTHKFYTQREYDEWKVITPNYKNWTHKYYKGLGGSKDAEIKDDFRTPRIVTCFYDAEAPAAIRLAFDKKLSDQRKDWIGRWRPVLGVDDIQMQPISWFINHEMILFSIADVQRSIPKLTDGLKESYRKIIYGAHKKWKIGSKTPYPEVKVAQFGGFVAGEAGYHHGETILDDVIVNMAQDFVGANNLPWFTRDGQFGSRYELGKDASQTRYSHVRPERLFSYILRKEDRPLFTPVIDDGKEIEPETYFPVICMALANGAEGIGTGYSTSIAKHDPLVLIDCHRKKLQGVPDKDLPPIHPWYRGYNGIMKVIDRRRRRRGKINVTTINNTAEDGTVTQEIQTKEVDDDDIDNTEDELYNPDEEEDISDVVGSRPLLSMVTFGKFHIDLNGTIVVTELPLKLSPCAYHKHWEQQVEDKKITGFRDLSIDNTIYFEIYGFKDSPNYRTLKLKRTMGMSNMVLLDENNRPVRYDTAFDVFEAFHSRRLPVYQRRKQYIIENLTREIATMTQKIRFIQAVINKEIRLINKTKASIYEGLDKLGIPHDIYDKSMNHHLSQDDITALTAQIASKEAERTIMEQTTPEQIWIRELDELEAVYRSVYDMKKQPITLTLGPQPKESFPGGPVKPNDRSLTMGNFATIANQPKRRRQPAKAITATNQPGIMLNVAPAQPGITLSLAPTQPQPTITLALTPTQPATTQPAITLALAPTQPQPAITLAIAK